MTTLPVPQITRYTRWLEQQSALHFDPNTTEGYEALWRWSVDNLDEFWASIWRYFDVQSPTPYSTVLVEDTMPGAQWFRGAQLNYAHQVFRHADSAHAAGHPAIVFQNERMREHGELQEVTWPELRRQVASLAAHLRDLGVGEGDRVVAFLPNTPQAAVAFLAVVSLGAVWSVCSPDMGPVAVLDRFRQIEPKVLIACDGYVYGGAAYERMSVLEGLLNELPCVQHVVLWRYLDEAASPTRLSSSTRQVHDFNALTADDAKLEPKWVSFDHPLWVVYSSGTTGLPKPIVHGHGGVVLEAIKMLGLHNNLGATVDTGDRYHWYSATGWIMWNSQIAGLLLGTTICIYDGSPSGKSGQPDWSTLWRFADDAKATFLGAGSAFFASCLKADVRPKEILELTHLRALGATGSPLATECYRWACEYVPKVDGKNIWLSVVSGGTDFAGAFIAGLPTLPVVEGEMQCRCLGAAIEAWNDKGEPLVDEVGELVCSKPMPSMPLYFWNDPGNRRYHDSYFDMFPGVWRHGDWVRITPTGGAVIYGRSDATINRYGIRMGTSELYRAVEVQAEVLDSLVVDLEYLGRESYMPLFVVLREGITLDPKLDRRLREAIKTALSARHVPNEIVQVTAIPRTLSGKKMELPVKKLLMGAPPEQVFKLDAMANADCVPWFVEFAKRRTSSA